MKTEFDRDMARAEAKKDRDLEQYPPVPSVNDGPLARIVLEEIQAAATELENNVWRVPAADRPMFHRRLTEARYMDGRPDAVPVPLESRPRPKRRDLVVAELL